MTSVNHYAASDGSYAGAFDTPGDAPAGAVATPTAPRRVSDIWDGAAWQDGNPTPEMVTAERDRRLRGTMTFGGNEFQVDLMSIVRISGAGSLAQGAIAAGAQPGDLRWNGGPVDFFWIAADNTPVPMDAQTMFAFAVAVATREAQFVAAARTLKAASPIPADYADNSYWPS